MAALAQALQRAVLEGVVIAAMWGDVIHNDCNDGAALREAEPTERLLFELSLTAATP